PDETYLFLRDSIQNYFTVRAENLNIDAGAGTDDGITPAAPGTPYPYLLLTGSDPNLNLQITHLEPTVDAGPNVSLLGSSNFIATGSFRDIGDPSNAWTATVD